MRPILAALPFAFLLCGTVSAAPLQMPSEASRPGPGTVPEILLAALEDDAAGLPAKIGGLFAPGAAALEPPAVTLTRLQALARQSGGVDVKRWDPHGSRLFFSGVTRRGSLPVDGMFALQDGKVLAFEMRRDPTVRASDAPPWPIAAADPEEAVRAVRAEIDWRAKAGRFSGAVVVAYRGRPVLNQAWGLAAQGPEAPNTPDTLFGTASATKMLTAAAVGRLIDQGALTLDTPVAKAVPALADAPGAGHVTLRDLLGHRVSYGDIFDERQRSLIPAHSRVTETLVLLRSRKPERAPGQEIAYSNANYLVLAAAIEAASDRSFYEFVKTEVMHPAGMTRSTYGQADARPVGAAVGLIKDSVSDPLGLGPFTIPDATSRGRGSPAGGVWSTAYDMWRFMDAVASGELITPKTRDAMLADRRRVGANLGAALGFLWRGRDEVTAFGHTGGGGNAGVSTSAFITPDREWAVVVLSNLSSPTGEMLGAEILEALRKTPRAQSLVQTAAASPASAR